MNTLTAVPSARLHLAETDYFTGFGRRRTGMLKTFGERSVLTERRRIIIGDFGGAKRAQNFLAAAKEKRTNARPKTISKLRRKESRVLFIRGFIDFFIGLAHALSTRYNPFQQRANVLRSKTRVAPVRIY